MEDESGGYVAFVPELPGCHTQGDTLEEVRKNVKEAIEIYLETLSKEEKEACSLNCFFYSFACNKSFALCSRKL